jgi:Na+-driven multidrug efflux pump
MIQDGVTYIRAFSFDFFFIPFAFCINGLLIGGGHTMFTLVSSMISSVLLRAPVCYFFGVVMGWGLFGVGLGAPVASVGAMVITVIFLLSGKWKENAVKTAQSAQSGAEF